MPLHLRTEEEGTPLRREPSVQAPRAWPSALDYQEAVQNPGAAFSDPALAAGSPAVNKLGLPLAAAGANAVVYELVEPGGIRHAVRCFTRPVRDQQERYSAVAAHIADIHLPFLIDFAFLPDGVRVRGESYPLVRMEWVEGQTLDTYLDGEPGAAALYTLVRQWRGLVNSLAGSGMAHGDLQHGNVLILPDGTLRLVDYDALFVPGLEGWGSLEVGHPNYQHPGRTARHFDARVDDFSALVIYLSLRAVAADPALWKRFNTGANLLFSRDDFAAPEYSPVFAALATSTDPGVRHLTSLLAEACSRPYEALPEFEATIAALPPLPAAPPRRRSPLAVAGPSAPAPRRPPTADEFWARVEAQQKAATPPQPSRNVGVAPTIPTAAPIQSVAASKRRVGEILAVSLGLIFVFGAIIGMGSLVGRRSQTSPYSAAIPSYPTTTYSQPTYRVPAPQAPQITVTSGKIGLAVPRLTYGEPSQGVLIDQATGERTGFPIIAPLGGSMTIQPLAGHRVFVGGQGLIEVRDLRTGAVAYRQGYGASGFAVAGTTLFTRSIQGELVAHDLVSGSKETLPVTDVRRLVGASQGIVVIARQQGLAGVDSAKKKVVWEVSDVPGRASLSGPILATWRRAERGGTGYPVTLRRATDGKVVATVTLPQAPESVAGLPGGRILVQRGSQLTAYGVGKRVWSWTAPEASGTVGAPTVSAGGKVYVVAGKTLVTLDGARGKPLGWIAL